MVGSNVTIERGEGRSVRGREYPWGVVDIENKVISLIVDFENKVP